MLLTHALIGLILGLSSASDPSAPATPKPKPKPVVIKAGRLFDGMGDVHRAGQVVVIEGERITAVGPAGQVKVPEGGDVIDLSGATVLPGLIDAHTHISMRADRYEEIAKFKDSPFQNAFAAVKYAKITLDSGFTTIRDLGGRPFLAVDLRISIDEGFIPGPRVVASGPAISMTGGHSDLNN